MTVTYWRDIPASVSGRSGKDRISRELSKRFQEAIDSAAMRSGAIDSDAYLNGWRKGSPIIFQDNLSDAISLLINNLEKEFGDKRLYDLVLSGGIAETE